MMNEVSTVAAAYAMAGFASDATHVSSSGTALAQTGIANAFANAANLASISTGAALAVTPAGNGTVPQAEINTLANVLAACVNSNGPGSTACSTLLSNAESNGSSGTVATDTATVAINLAHNPGTNVASLYALASGTPPFAPALSVVPNDFTVALSFTGGGLNGPSAIAIDSFGNAWVGNSAGVGDSVSEFSSLGAAVSPSAGFKGGGLANPETIAIDTFGNIWLANNGAPNSLTKLSSSGTAISPSTGYQNNGLSGPSGLAIDGFGNVWVSNSGGNTLVEFSNSGTALSPSRGYGYNPPLGGLNNCASVTIDGSENVWVANGNSTFSELSNAGIAMSPSTGFPVPGGIYLASVATDNSGNLWTLTGGSLYKIGYSGGVLTSSPGITGGGIYSTFGMSIDGAGQVWVTSEHFVGFPATYKPGTITQISNSGVAISPSTGFQASGMIYVGLVAVDGSGNVWVPDGGNYVFEFIGAAVPVVTPVAAGVKNNMLGTRP